MKSQRTARDYLSLVIELTPLANQIPTCQRFFARGDSGSTFTWRINTNRRTSISRDDCAAKLWLDPLEFAHIDGFRRHECNEITRIAAMHLDEFIQAWYQIFGGFNHE